MMKKRYCPDLVSHMAECDANYFRLLKLVPAMLNRGNRGSPPDRDTVEIGIYTDTEKSIQVTIRITEQFKYTTSLSIHLHGDSVSPWIRWPALQVRVYHDMKTAEVSSFEQHRNFQSRYEYPNHRMFHPDEKTQLNRFLGELLSHCLANGHSLEPVVLGRI